MFSPIFSTVTVEADAKDLCIIYGSAALTNDQLTGAFEGLTLYREGYSPAELARRYQRDWRTLEMKDSKLFDRKFSIDILPVQRSDIAVASIEAAEDAVLSIPTTNKVLEYDRSEPLLTFRILINRAANSIAVKTKRGAGNRVFMHPDNIALLEDRFYDPCDATVGLWHRFGTYGTLQFLSSDQMDRNRAVVMFCGEHPGDAPAQLVRRDGRVFLSQRQEGGAIFGTAGDYIATIQLT